MHRNSQYRGNRQRGADDFDDRSRMQHGDERSGSYGTTSGNYEDRDDARFDPAGDRRRSSEEYYGGRGQGGARYGEEERWGRGGQRGYDYGEREYDNDYTRHGHEGGGYGRSERDNFSGAEWGSRGYGHEPEWSRAPHGSYGVNRGEGPWQGGRYSSRGGGAYDQGGSFGQGSAFGQRERSFGSGAAYPSGQRRDYSNSGYEPEYGGEEVGGDWRQGRTQIERSRYGGSSSAGQAHKRGPKGWQRSDERVKEDICERLYHEASIDSSEVTVDVSSGNVSLAGTVPDRRMKHAVEDLIDACPGVKDIDNRIRVQRLGESASSTTSGSTSTQGASATSGSQSAGRDRKE
jgi:osmotically-inducible protein OsmY